MLAEFTLRKTKSVPICQENTGNLKYLMKSLYVRIKITVTLILHLLYNKGFSTYAELKCELPLAIAKKPNQKDLPLNLFM